MIETVIQHNPEQNCFEAEIDGSSAVLDYQRISNTLMITETLVPIPLEGQGVGSALVKAVLEFAREQGLTVAPLCPFAASYIDRHPEYADLVRLR